MVGGTSMNHNNRIVVAVEGIDGAGKSTLILEIEKFLKDNISIYQRTRKGKITEKILNSRMFQKYHFLQIPIYLILSYVNFYLFKMKCKNTQIIIMDRCFLSNICYFFPQALYDEKKLKKVLFWEIKLLPKTVFILDVDPVVGMIRDNNRKKLDWLSYTREAYLSSQNSLINKLTHIVILKEELSTKEKAKILIEYIQGEKEHGN